MIVAVDHLRVNAGMKESSKNPFEAGKKNTQEMDAGIDLMLNNLF